VSIKSQASPALPLYSDIEGEAASMEWSERMNAAIDYIEENLAGEVDFSIAAERACCSTFHFQRMFFAIIGLTPAEYARRRRLTLAARELTTGSPKVIDVALKYGYDSPEAFTRAFRSVHGTSPTAAREPGVTLTAFPRVSFNIILKGGSDMDYTIIEKTGFNIALTKRQFSTAGGQNFVLIPQFWQEFLKSPDYAAMIAFTGGKVGAVTRSSMLGVCWVDKPINDPHDYEFYYGIAVELPPKGGTGKFEKMAVPAATWAVFDCTLENLQDVTRRIFSEWFPSTGYEHDDKPELEIYFPEDPRSKVMQCQIWMPVVKKK
jgi:AraC family transcriptional regulator